MDFFKPQQPRIPGVLPSAPPEEEKAPSENVVGRGLEKAKVLAPLLWVALTVAGIAASGAAMLWLTQKRAQEVTPAASPKVDLDVPGAKSTKAADHLPIAPGPIATADDLSKPWSSRRFLFRSPITSELLPAVVVHVPGGDLWAISLREPFGTCDMEYVTNLNTLKTKYNYEADHPMVVDPCNGGVFDLSIYGSGPNGMVRGEIVAGTAVRPPLAIKTEKRDKEVFAVQME